MPAVTYLAVLHRGDDETEGRGATPSAAILAAVDRLDPEGTLTRRCRYSGVPGMFALLSLDAIHTRTDGTRWSRSVPLSDSQRALCDADDARSTGADLDESARDGRL